MIVLCVTNCPASLRGDLSKWLCEINTGVYVGRINAKVREELWERLCGNIKSGQATMVYSTNNEQGYAFRTHHTTWRPVDYEGITLMQKPSMQSSQEAEVSFLAPGFSKAAKYEKIKRLAGRTKMESYVVLDIETTGLDWKRDRIIEVGLLKVQGEEIQSQFQCFIQSSEIIQDDVAALTGITNEMLQSEGLAEDVALEKIREFIGDELVIGYNLKFDLNFIQKLGDRMGKPLGIKRTRDVKQLARRKLEDLKNDKLETAAAHFSLETDKMHRALENCILIYKVYLELNKL